MTIHQDEEQMLTRLAALSEVGAAGHVGPGEVVRPVDDVEHTEHRGKHDPEEGKKIYIGVIRIHNIRRRYLLTPSPFLKHLVDAFTLNLF